MVEVVVAEELDVSTVARLAQLLEEAMLMRPDHLFIDLAECVSIDASAIGLLLRVHRQVTRDGGQLTLRSPSPRLRRKLRLARADRALDISPAAEDV